LAAAQKPCSFKKPLFTNEPTFPMARFLFRRCAMLFLEISNEESQILKNVLENCLADLRMEITKTDNLRYKEMLKKRKAVLLKIRESIIKLDEEAPIAG
jgi:hypothetical protein